MAITRRQRELYDFISRFVSEKAYSHAFEEIKGAMGLSSLATVHKHVSNLEKKGLLTRDFNRSRSIDLLPAKGRLKQSMAVNLEWCCRWWGGLRRGIRWKRWRTRGRFRWRTSCLEEVFVSQCAVSRCRTSDSDGDYVLVEKYQVGA